MNAIGIVSKAGRYGGAYAHIDTAKINSAQVAYTYANETDILNVVLFGKTENLESYNAVLIN